MNKTNRQSKTIFGMSKKSLYKTISYRIVSTGTNFFLAYLWFDEGIKSIGMFTALAAAVASVIYFYHEKFYKIARKNKWLNI